MAVTRRSNHSSAPYTTPKTSKKPQRSKTQSSTSNGSDGGNEMNLEINGMKETATLQLETDEESTEEGEEQQDGDGAEWQKVNKHKKTKANHQQTQSSKEAEVQVSPQEPPKIQLDMDDVSEGLDYWANAIFGYVLGANPPWTVIHGFAQRLWKEKGLEQVSFMPNGIFIVRFKTKEAQLEALQNDTIIFDNKPVIIEEWTPESEIIKKEIKEVPIWAKLRNLELRFWGEKCFMKLASGIGRYIESDNATKTRQFLGFAKVKVMVKMDQEFPTTVEFLDEMGQEQIIGVSYDWLPITCNLCKGVGHVKEDCRKARAKPGSKKTWQPKIPAPPRPASPANPLLIRPVAPVNPPLPSTPAPQAQHRDSTHRSPPPITPTPQVHHRDNTLRSRTQEGDKQDDNLFQPGGPSFLDKLTMSIQRDIMKQAEMEAGNSLLHG